MTTRLAIIFASIIAALVVLDFVLNGGSNFLFAIRKFIELMEWMAFWR